MGRALCLENNLQDLLTEKIYVCVNRSLIPYFQKNVLIILS